MAKDSHIGWTDDTWNPWGWVCNRVGKGGGCDNCYMFTMADRFGKSDPATTDPLWRNAANAELEKMGSNRVIFVNSMSDTYHRRVPFEYTKRIHDAAVQHRDKVFLILTKRPHRALEMADKLQWPRNLWIGTSIARKQDIHRLQPLVEMPTCNVFVSAEPLLESVAYEIQPFVASLIKWLIVGGESGPNYRAFDKQWAAELRDVSLLYSVPFFFKQGSAFKSGQDRILHGRTWEQTPDWSHYTSDQPEQMRMFD